MKLGELLADLRKEKNILQKEVATYLNVTVATISNYEKGVHSPDYETLVKLADFFDVSTDYLLQRTDYKASIGMLNQRLVNNYTVSDLLNTVLTLDDHSLRALLDYYELLVLRNTVQKAKKRAMQAAKEQGLLSEDPLEKESGLLSEDPLEKESGLLSGDPLEIQEIDITEDAFV